MNYYDILGFAAGTLTTISFAPQLIKAWKSKETKDLSLGMFCIITLGIALWLIYGILTKSMPVILANAVTMVLAFAILILKLKYK